MGVRKIKEDVMKSEKQIKEKLELYQWYFDNVVETPETKGYIEGFKVGVI